MSTRLCITVRWLGDRFHGMVEDKTGPEWPPSPFRLFQALVSSAYQHGLYDTLLPALEWLERQGAPEILAERNPHVGNGFDHFVPDNDNLINHKKPVVRVFKPVLFEDRSSVTYVWECRAGDLPPLDEMDELCSTLGTFGCGVDQAFAAARLAGIAVADAEKVGEPLQFKHCPGVVSHSSRGTLRTPRVGTLEDLNRVFKLNRQARVVHHERRKKRWPSVFQRFAYSGLCEVPQRPHAVFKIECDDEERRFAYPQSKLIHIAGMVRHLAIELMKHHPPRGLRGRDPAEWLDAYVAGHQSVDEEAVDRPHAQLSFVPLPSTGHAHTDPAVRRVMIVAPIGDDPWLDHLAQRLDGQLLRPLPGTNLPLGTRLELTDARKKDGVRDLYTGQSRAWASFTPVILPGHDDHKPEKTRKLILKALAQSGIDQPCEFEWSAFSAFSKAFSAHKYVRDESAKDGKRRIGYIRPDHLENQTAIHLVLRFGRRKDPNDPDSRWIPAEQPVPGPLIIGAGRHCGFGLMAVQNDG